MTVRAKMMLTSVTSNSWSATAKNLKFTAQYDMSIPEDQRFQKATPSAQFDMSIDNPAALEQFELGKCYYVDFTPADQPVA